MGRVPKVSVIIPSYNARATIEPCLSSLLRQSRAPLEILVVDSSTDGTAAIVASKFPGVRLVCSSARKYPGVARNFGAAQAQGQLFAFLDADCTVAPDWLAEIEKCWQHQGHPVMAGAIHNGTPQSAVGWGYYFCSFSQWSPPANLSSVFIKEAATGCLIVARSVFELHGPFSEERFCEDTTFCWKLRKAGLLPLFVPSIRAYHTSRDGLGGMLRRRFLHGRALARARDQARPFGLHERLLRMIGAPLVPGILLYRSARSILGNRHYTQEFIWALPLTLMGHVTWSCGEFAEYFSALGLAEGKRAMKPDKGIV